LPEDVKRNKWIFFVGMLLLILSIYRDGSSTRDYLGYVDLYNRTDQQVELSFYIIGRVVKNIFCNNVLFLFLIYAIIGICLKLKAVQQLSTFWAFSMLIYISNFFILHELTQIRVGVASGFMLLCIKPVYDKDWKRFLLFSAGAIFFHYLGLLVLPLWFLRKKKVNSILFSSLLPLAYLVYFLKINVIESVIPLLPIEYIQHKYASYQAAQAMNMDSFNKINVFNYVFLAKCGIYYILLWKNKIITEQNNYAPLLIKIQGIALTCFVLLAAMPVYAFRISEFFGVVELITIPMLIYTFKPIQFLTRIGVALFAFAVLLINIFYVGLIY
jgi:hypothetical protein